MTNRDGLYIDGEHVPYTGTLEQRINEPTRLIPAVRLAEGSTAEAWKHGRLVARFVSLRGIAVDPMETLADSAASGEAHEAPASTAKDERC